MAKPKWIAQHTSRMFVDSLLRVRARNTHKGDYGKVLLLCGSCGLSGAAVLAAKAASRTGSGLVYLGVPEAIYPIAASHCLSQIVFPLACDEEGKFSSDALIKIEQMLPKMDAVLIGPGIGRGSGISELVFEIVKTCTVPLVLDADGINAMEGHIDFLRGSSCPTILTPHDGEFARLGGDAKTDDRIAEAMRIARLTESVVLLKGHRTVITDGLNIYRNVTGNPGMATGGSGDVLSGIIVSLLGQHIMPLEAAAAGAWIHGMAGDICASEIGEYGMLPEDMIERIPRLLK
ncbi:MAG: NAD(P)H-hydrate dehydratase [Oscillospiraceae bacterium]|nr:NAD(P)H-hydrate dehydratase [Oscillospiraceae bacterium]